MNHRSTLTFKELKALARTLGIDPDPKVYGNLDGCIKLARNAARYPFSKGHIARQKALVAYST